MIKEMNKINTNWLYLSLSLFFLGLVIWFSNQSLQQVNQLKQENSSLQKQLSDKTTELASEKETYNIQNTKFIWFLKNSSEDFKTSSSANYQCYLNHELPSSLRLDSIKKDLSDQNTQINYLCMKDDIYLVRDEKGVAKIYFFDKENDYSTKTLLEGKKGINFGQVLDWTIDNKIFYSVYGYDTIYSFFVSLGDKFPSSVSSPGLLEFCHLGSMMGYYDGENISDCKSFKVSNKSSYLK